MYIMNTCHSASLCYDPTAGNFDINHVKKESAASFVFLYMMPIAISFFATCFLIMHTSLRLQKMFNAALLKLLMRLIPGPIIFSLALVPSVVFQVIEVTTGNNTGIVKKISLLGVNFSGALYALFYFYACLVDNSMYTTTSARNGTRARAIENGNRNSQIGMVSWTSGHSTGGATSASNGSASNNNAGTNSNSINGSVNGSNVDGSNGQFSPNAVNNTLWSEQLNPISLPNKLERLQRLNSTGSTGSSLFYQDHDTRLSTGSGLYNRSTDSSVDDTTTDGL
jgi:hypothetical protein